MSYEAMMLDRSTSREKGPVAPVPHAAHVVSVSGSDVTLDFGNGVASTTSEKQVHVLAGDMVETVVLGRRLVITANYTHPVTDDTKAAEALDLAQVADEAATQAQQSADEAQDSADAAGKAASDAQKSADDAGTAAQSAWDHAESALTAAGAAWDYAAEAETAAHDAAGEARDARASAIRANTSANDALAQLSTVQDVVGTLTWLSEHGRYEPTQDTAVDPGKTYYVREAPYDGAILTALGEALFTGAGDAIVAATSAMSDGWLYVPVAEPTEADLGSYYELTVDEAVTHYVASHLALTDAGLWVVKDESGYRLLVANDGVSVVDPEGHVVATYGESIDFDSSRPQHIGGENAFILYYDADGDGRPDSLYIGGSNVTIGGRSLSDVLAGIDSAVTDSGMEWATHDSMTDPTGISSWSSTYVAPTSAKPYVWVRQWQEVDGEVTYGDPGCITGAKGDAGATGPQGPKGDTGPQGADGTGISSVTVSYGTSASAATQPSSSSWSETPPTSLAEGTWLWTRTVTSYTDGTDTTAYSKSYVGTSGAPGTTYYTHIRYSASADGTGHVATPSASTVYIGTYTGTSSSAPSAKSSYKWSRYVGTDGNDGHSPAITTSHSGTTTTIYADGTAIGTVEDGSDGSTPSITATKSDGTTTVKVDGVTVATIVDGKSVTVSKVEYGTSASAATQPSTSSWSETPPTSVAQGRWLWVRTTYSDSTVATTKSYIGTDGEDGKSVYVKSSTKSGDTTTVVLTDGTTDTTLTIADGADGSNGTPGKNGYVHTAWANSADGTTGFSTTVSAGKQYLGVCTDNTQADPTTPSSYSWSLIKGEKGDAGATGPQGPKGDTGPQGVGVASNREQWYVSTSKDEVSGGSWSYSQPEELGPSQWLWMRLVTTWTDGNVTCGTPVLDANASGVWHTVAGIKEGQTSLELEVKSVREVTEVVQYDHVVTHEGDLWTFVGQAWRGRELVTSEFDEDQFFWVIVSEDGERLWSRGVEAVIPESEIGYGSAVRGCLDIDGPEVGALATSHGDSLVTSGGDSLISRDWRGTWQTEG